MKRKLQNYLKQTLSVFGNYITRQFYQETKLLIEKKHTIFICGKLSALKQFVYDYTTRLYLQMIYKEHLCW